MADQQNRGGKKAGAQEPSHSEKHQKAAENPARPAAGQPGGPKPNEGKPRPEHHK